MEHAPSVIAKYLTIFGVTEDTLLHWWLAPYRMVCLGISTKLCHNDYLYNEEGIAYWLVIGKHIAATGKEWGSVSQMVGVVIFGFLMAVLVAVESMVMFLATPAGICGLVIGFITLLFLASQQFLAKQPKSAS